MTHATHERQLSPPEVGARVYTLDRDDLGTVKEVSGSSFKIDAPWARDYWLSCEYIGETEPGSVQLVLVKNRLGDYKLAQPADAAGALSDGVRDGLISDAEMDEQRRRMEVELEDQRTRLN
ncbi:MAG: hypothetical protein WEC33_02235 [Dehalococcoidia bacterium]